jgi:hypothetical protein
MAPPPRLRILSGEFNFSLDVNVWDTTKKKKMVRRLTRVCVVGGNAISAFLSWRLQATTSCDVTLVWKSGFDAVSQYGVSFKYVSRFLCHRQMANSLRRSKAFGNERFKPRHGEIRISPLGLSPSQDPG